MEVAALIDRFRGPLVGLIASWGAPWELARELAQDVFAEAYLGRVRFRGDLADPAQSGPYLRGIARHLWHAHRRRASNRRETNLSEEALGHADDASTGADPVSERMAALRVAIRRLPEDLREAVQMHYLEETRVRNVALLLGVPEKTVEGRLYRARRELKRILGSEDAARGERSR